MTGGWQRTASETTESRCPCNRSACAHKKGPSTAAAWSHAGCLYLRLLNRSHSKHTWPGSGGHPVRPGSHLGGNTTLQAATTRPSPRSSPQWVSPSVRLRTYQLRFFTGFGRPPARCTSGNLRDRRLYRRSVSAGQPLSVDQVETVNNIECSGLRFLHGFLPLSRKPFRFSYAARWWHRRAATTSTGHVIAADVIFAANGHHRGEPEAELLTVLAQRDADPAGLGDQPNRPAGDGAKVASRHTGGSAHRFGYRPRPRMPMQERTHERAIALGASRTDARTVYPFAWVRLKGLPRHRWSS